MATQIDPLPSPIGRTVEPPHREEAFTGFGGAPRMQKASEMMTDPLMGAAETVHKAGAQQEQIQKAREFARLLEGDVTQNLMAVAQDFDASYPEFNGSFSSEAATVVPFLKAPNIKSNEASELVLNTMKSFADRVQKKEFAEGRFDERKSLEELKSQLAMDREEAKHTKRMERDKALFGYEKEVERLKKRLTFHFGRKGKEKDWKLLREEAENLQAAVDKEKAVLEAVLADKTEFLKHDAAVRRLTALAQTERLLIKATLDAAGGGSKPAGDEEMEDEEPPASPAPKPTGKGPKPGAVRGGYRFKGGDPNKQENWEKI